MIRSEIYWVFRVLAIILTVSSLPVLAIDSARPLFIPQKKSVAVSNRLIVKLKPDRLAGGLSAAQIATELRHPLSADTLYQLQAAAGAGLTELHALSNGSHILILQGSPDIQTLNRGINNIRNLSNVAYVEEDRILTTQAAPNDAEYGRLWGLQLLSAVNSPAPGKTGNYGADFENAWNINTGSGIVVAVVDTGITPHGDIVGVTGTVSPATGNLVSSGYDFISDCRIRGSCSANTSDTLSARTPSVNATDLGDFISQTDINNNPALFPGPVTNSSWHGTHVSGTIAAIGNNSTGVIGGAFSARILPVRVLGKGGGYLSDITEGVRWAAGIHSTISNPNPAKVINLSLGGTGACSATEQDAINAVVAVGAVIVVSAGNDNTDVTDASPANCSNVITVAAIARDGSRAAYSNFSSPISNTTHPVQVTLAAPGGDKSLGSFDPGIYSTLNSGTTTAAASSYAYYQGTSMAAPHVAAAAALMLSRNPTLNPAQIKAILSASVTAFPSFSPAGWAPYDCATLKNCGTGILNANLAVLSSIMPFTTATPTIDFGTLYTSDPISKTVTLTNSSGANVILGAASIAGVNFSSFIITSNTCTGSIAAASTCQVTISFSPKAANTNSAVLFIPAQPATNGAITVAVTGVASLPLSAATVLAATKGRGSSSGSSGGCSVIPAGGNPDISLLLSMLTLLAYSFRQRLSLSLGKD